MLLWRRGGTDSGAMPSRSPLVCALLFVALSAAACAGTEKGAGSAGESESLVGNPAPDFQLKAVTAPRERLAPVAAGPGRDPWLPGARSASPARSRSPSLRSLIASTPRRACRSSGSARTRPRTRTRSPISPKRTARPSRSGGTATRRRAAYKPETMPSSFPHRQDGVVRFAHVGFHDGEEVEIERKSEGFSGEVDERCSRRRRSLESPAPAVPEHAWEHRHRWRARSLAAPAPPAPRPHCNQGLPSTGRCRRPRPSCSNPRGQVPSPTAKRTGRVRRPSGGRKARARRRRRLRRTSRGPPDPEGAAAAVVGHAARRQGHRGARRRVARRAFRTLDGLRRRGHRRHGGGVQLPERGHPPPDRARIGMASWWSAASCSNRCCCCCCRPQQPMRPPGDRWSRDRSFEYVIFGFLVRAPWSSRERRGCAS